MSGTTTENGKASRLSRAAGGLALALVMGSACRESVVQSQTVTITPRPLFVTPTPG